MSRVHVLPAEELMQPAFACSGRRSLDLRSEADVSPEFCSVPEAIRSRPGVRSLTRSVIRNLSNERIGSSKVLNRSDIL